MANKLVILDRDGVINEHVDDHIRSAEQWKPIPGSLEAIARLNQAGYSVAVVTNQSGLSRGYLDIDALHAIHNKMQRALADLGGHIDAIFYCPHAPADDCECRKPKPGLLHDLSNRLRAPLVGTPFVGDSLRDLQAGMAVGAMPVLVRTGRGESTLEKNAGLEQQLAIFDDLAQFVDNLLTVIGEEKE